MYCKYCGEQINVNDKYCPYCGKSNMPSTKNINIDSNISADSLRKRAFAFIEDGDTEKAQLYLDRLLDLHPEDAQAYLGKLFIDKGVRNKNELIEYYKELYNDEQEVIKNASLSEEEKEHINNVIEDKFIPFYLDKGVIDSLYKEFDLSYFSMTPTRTKQKNSIDSEFENNNILSRFMMNADKQLKKEFNDIKNIYQKRLKASQKKDEEIEAKIRESFDKFVENTDETIKEMHEEALKKREEDYQEFSSKIETSSQISELNDLKSNFLLMGDFKEAKLRAEECDEKIIEIENILKQKQEIANQRNKKIMTGAIIAFVVLIIALLVYQFIVVPENRYKEATVSLESGDYENAIIIFSDLKSYKDSNEQLKIAIIKKAEVLNKNEEYQDAVDILLPIKDEVNAQEVLYEAKYGLANQRIEEGEYSEAIAVLDSIIDYKDASTRKMQAIYEKAIVLREEKEFDKAIELFDQIIDYEDAAQQKSITEQNKRDNSVSVPNYNGKSIYDVGASLERLGLTYKIKEIESQNEKAGLVVNITPAPGTILYRGSEVQLTVTRGLTKYDEYRGDGNRSVLYQINITPAVKQIIMRTTPHIVTTNKTGSMAKSGAAYNVYETVYNEGYTWIRTDNNEWFATDKGWIEQDTYCSNRGDYTVVKAWIKSSDGSGVYDKPVENANSREWLEHLDYGTEITIYYRFNSGGHRWYKIGANKWIKDLHGEKIAYY